MAKLSVCIITHNEENNIANCLESVRWADEIIVTDCESTDRTVEIVKQYPAKLLTRPNNNNLNINKQFGIDQARNEWILYLDADEVVPEELKEEIQQILATDNNTSGYWMPRQNIILGKWLKHGGSYPDYQLRLFNKTLGSFPCKHVHEHPKVEGNLGYLSNHLIHFNIKSIPELIGRVDRYSTFQAEVLYSDGRKITTANTPWFLVVKPVLRFAYVYLFKQGFRDGYPGLIFCAHAGFNDFLNYAKLWELQRRAV